RVESEQARVELATAELNRARQLIEAGHIARESLERTETDSRQAEAGLRSARFAVDVARHERENAQAALAMADGNETTPVTVSAPVSGVVLSRLRQSEGTVQMGEPLLALGDLAGLEVEVDLLSPDAVRLQPGMRV